MKPEITLDEWRTNLENQRRFSSFWSNVSSIQIAPSTPEGTQITIVKAMERYASRKETV